MCLACTAPFGVAFLFCDLFIGASDRQLKRVDSIAEILIASPPLGLDDFEPQRAKVQAMISESIPMGRTVLQTDDARQGVTGHKVRYVLGFGLAGVIISFMVVGFMASRGWLGAV
jgi:hypothetical protein